MDNKIDDFPDQMLVAIGGRALAPTGDPGGTPIAVSAATALAESLLPILVGCRRLLITHGHDFALEECLLRLEAAPAFAAVSAFDVSLARADAGIGYRMAQALHNAQQQAGRPRLVVYLPCEVEVDPDDDGLDESRRTLGPVLSAYQAQLLHEQGWSARQFSDTGWKVCLPTLVPAGFSNLGAIERLLGEDGVVIAGGGIPVARGGRGTRQRVSALVDNDMRSARLARALGMTELLLLTVVPRVAIRFRQPGERWLDTVTASRLRAYRDEGHFDGATMQPKVDAALDFLAAGGRRVVVAHVDDATAAIRGEAGTQILPD